MTPINLRKECLWLNNKITYNKKVLFWKDWHECGINIIHDIMKTDGNFLTLNELQIKYEIKCSFLKYNRLKDVIPKEWRKVIKTQRIANSDLSFSDPIFLKINKNLKSLSLITNKDIYWIHVREKQIAPIIKEKLGQMLDIEESDWENIFLISKTVRNTKLRAFQYKVLFNLIPCNLYLKRIKRNDTDKCDQCGMLDDQTHYFYECNQNRIFWSGFNKWWMDVTGINIQIDQKIVLVGCLENTECVDELNACILIAKWHIYRNKLNNELIFFYKYLCELKYALMIEKRIALRSNNMQKFDKTWQKIEEYIT